MKNEIEENKKNKEVQKQQTKERELKTKYHYCVPVTILQRDVKNNSGGIVAEMNKKNEILRLRFESKVKINNTEEKINITWKPKKAITKNSVSEDLGIPNEIKDSELYTASEFKTLFPEIVEIAKQCLIEEQIVIMAYTEQEFFNEREEEIETYYFIKDWQCDMLNNSEEQEKHKQRHSEESLV